MINSSTMEHPYTRTVSKLKLCKSFQKNNLVLTSLRLSLLKPLHEAL